MQQPFLPIETIPIFLFAAVGVGLAVVLLIIAGLFNPGRTSRVKQMPYESGVDPIHDARRRFDVRFYLLAIAFVVFDVELLFLYPWAVANRPAEARTAVEAAEPIATAAPGGIDAAVALGPSEGYVQSRGMVFGGVMIFLALLVLGFVYDWRKGIFRWR